MSKAKVIFTLDSIDLIIPCNQEDKMKNICQKFITKVGINMNSVFFLYGGNRINFELKFKEQANSIDRGNKKMRVLVYKNENDEFICTKCGEQIKLSSEKIDEIIASNKNIQDVINGIKFNIENTIKISTINALNIQLKNINLLLNTITEDIKKNNEKLNNLLKDNKNNYEQNKKDINNKEIPKVKELESDFDELNNKENKSLSHKSEEENETEVNEEDSIYIGAKDLQGKKQGFGIKIFSGNKFKGIFTNDKVSGWGIYEHKDGDIFRGEYKDDETNGYGEYSKENSIYYGYWDHDMQAGIGYEIWNDSSSYSGEYKNGKKNGIGYYIWLDGTTYEGEWKDNNIEGYGTYKYSDGRQYIGEWKNNQMNGYGEFSWIEGKKYIGFYKDDKKEGFGIFYWPNDRIFIGFWKEGKQNGVGKYIKDDISKYGIWKDGKNEKWFENEDEFLNSSKSEKFIDFFQWDTNKIKKYQDLDDNTEEEEKSEDF